MLTIVQLIKFNLSPLQFTTDSTPFLENIYKTYTKFQLATSFFVVLFLSEKIIETLLKNSLSNILWASTWELFWLYVCVTCDHIIQIRWQLRYPISRQHETGMCCCWNSRFFLDENEIYQLVENVQLLKKGL